MRHRIEVLHGVNLDMLGARPAQHYGTLTLDELEFKLDGFAEELGLEISTFQTNSETEFVERLHRAREMDDGLILNPGAWTHYSWAIRDALEISGLPAVEVHLSDIATREDWRQLSVIRELCFATISGKGVDGYREALEVLALRLEQDGGA
ncbi:MAG: 3-dehydroquinate dehydratase [Thermoleophilaceae bacterium]|nr:3-dehydroquinate dehydratase [Thermoleophilaceae bacterium]